MKWKKVDQSNKSLPPESQSQTASPSSTVFNQEALPRLPADKKTKRKQHQFRLIGSAAIFLLLLSLTSQAGRDWISSWLRVLASQPNSSEVPNSELPSVRIVPVEAIAVEPVDSYQVSRVYSGTLVPRRSSELGFERGGKVSLINVDEGERVEAGSAIASLDTRLLEAQKRELLAKRSQLVAQLSEMQAGPRVEAIASAQATVRALSEQLELARQKRARRESLYAQGAISREQLDEILSEASTRQARVDEARSQLDELQAGTRSEQVAAQTALIEQLDAEIGTLDIELQQSVLRAPFSGTISGRLIDEGTVVSAGQPLLKLVEDEATEARIGVPTAVASRLAVGSTQMLQIGQANYLAQVSAILPELDSSTRTATVVLALDGSARTEATLGQIAKLELTEDMATSGYWLPLSALVQGERGLWSCYVLDEATQADSTDANSVFRVEQQNVEIIHTESDRALVRGTLQPGNQVIVSGTHRLVAGQLASPISVINEQ